MMADMDERRLTSLETADLLESLSVAKTPVEFDADKQTVRFIDTDNAARLLTLPLIWPKTASLDLGALAAKLRGPMPSYAIILIQAGAAAIGFYEGGDLLRHRVIKKYMIRKSQGKSQMKHLKSKGKSRLGSRIRLQNSILFFEEINETLQEWHIAECSESILLFLPVNLQNPLFTAAVQVPFEKSDPRIRRIPIDVHVPSFKELGHIQWLVSRGMLLVQ